MTENKQQRPKLIASFSAAFGTCGSFCAAVMGSTTGDVALASPRRISSGKEHRRIACLPTVCRTNYGKSWHSHSWLCSRLWICGTGNLACALRFCFWV